jgi:hypothetical protein
MLHGILWNKGQRKEAVYDVERLKLVIMIIPEDPSCFRAVWYFVSHVLYTGVYIVILPVISCGRKTWYLTLRASESRLPREIFALRENDRRLEKTE